MAANTTNHYPHISMMQHVKQLFTLPVGTRLKFPFPSYYGDEFRLNVFFTGKTILVGYKLQESWAYHIKYAEQKTQFEGKKYWFICPIKGCRKRVDKLYLKDELLGCRKCHKLLYPSQNRSKYTLPIYKLERLEKKLKGKGRWGSPPPRPQGMHHQTYEKLAREYADTFNEIMRQGEYNIANYKKPKSSKTSKLI